MNELLSQMLAHADPSQVAGLARFFKTGPGQYGEGDRFLGIKVPVTREVVKACWRDVDVPALEECIASPYHEVRLAALLALVEIFRHAGKGRATPAGQVMPRTPGLPLPLSLSRQACIDFYLAHTQFINNWDLVDLSCYPLLGEWLLDKDRTLLYDLARSGKTLWEQRIGIVSTMTFIRHGQLQDTFAIADILLHHPHNLIHKAVGWLLREAGKRDKAALEAYLLGTRPPEGTPPGATSANTLGTHSTSSTTSTTSTTSTPGAHSTSHTSSPHSAFSTPRYRQMPRTLLRYAIEKFPEDERQGYLTGKVH